MLEPREGSQYPQSSRYPYHPHPHHLLRMMQLIHQYIWDTQLQCRYPAEHELSVMFEAWQRRWDNFSRSQQATNSYVGGCLSKKKNFRPIQLSALKSTYAGYIRTYWQPDLVPRLLSTYTKINTLRGTRPLTTPEIGRFVSAHMYSALPIVKSGL